MEYIKDNYMNELTLETVAQAIFISPSYLCGLFKQSIGESFVDYIHRVRMEKAKQLMVSESCSIAQISAMVGYQNEKYFSRVFKKTTGLAPSQFRDQMCSP